MEPTSLIWSVGIAAFVGGGLVGAVLYRLFTPAAKNMSKLQSRLEESEREMAEYKAKVTDHFGKTSEMVNDLTQDYVRVYKHLAEGAQILGDPEKSRSMLEQYDSKTLISFAEEESIDPASQQIISEAVRKAAEAVRETSDDTPAPESAEEPTPVTSEAGADVVAITTPAESTETAPTEARSSAAEAADDQVNKMAEIKEAIKAPEEIRKSA